nr:MAG TPA: hypothetical protein [Caudoviricetes sp.]
MGMVKIYYAFAYICYTSNIAYISRYNLGGD